MRPDLSVFMKSSGEKFRIVRNGVNIAEVEGLHNHEKSSGRKYIGFYPKTDVQEQDIVISLISGDKFYVEEIENHVVFNSLFQIKAFYLTERERSRENNQREIGGLTFNIGAAYGSIIGTQTTATLTYNAALEELRQRIQSDTSVDKPELENFLAEIHNLVENQTTVDKGFLSRFASLIQRNSWLTGPTTTLLLHWLTSH